MECFETDKMQIVAFPGDRANTPRATTPSYMITYGTIGHLEEHRAHEGKERWASWSRLLQIFLKGKLAIQTSATCAERRHKHG